MKEKGSLGEQIAIDLILLAFVAIVIAFAGGW